MAKELPYFKFEPSQWENGNIQMCSDLAKLHFINICSTYWSRLGDLSKRFALMKCCNNNEQTLNELINDRIIGLDGEKIVVRFLDSQLSDFIDLSKARSESGKKGGYSGGVRPSEERINGNQLYIIYCHGNGEEFLKLGTTSNCVSRRYSGKMPYEYNLIFQLVTDDYLNLESEYCEVFAKFNYVPKLSFQGQKECYSIAFFDEISGILEQRHSIALAPLKRSEAIREEKRRVKKSKEDESVGAGKPASLTIEERSKVFMTKIAEHLNTYSQEMCRNFYDYWTEKNEGAPKMRFEMEKVFDVAKRLRTWSNNEKKIFKGNGRQSGVTAEGTLKRFNSYS